MLLLILFLKSASCYAGLGSPLIGVWRYFGRDYSQVKFRELRLQNGGFKASGTYTFSSTGKPIATTYLPEGAEFGSDENFTSYWGENPVKSEIEAAPPHPSDPNCGLLILNQLFAVNGFVERKLIPPEYAHEMLLDSAKLRPDTVSFYETLGTESETLIKRRLGEVPKYARLRPNLNATNFFGFFC